jgi:hypothetical protein
MKRILIGLLFVQSAFANVLPPMPPGCKGPELVNYVAYNINAAGCSGTLCPCTYKPCAGYGPSEVRFWGVKVLKSVPRVTPKDSDKEWCTTQSCKTQQDRNITCYKW